MIVSRLNSADVEAHWPLFEPHFEGFAEASHGEMTVDDLRKMVSDRTRQCWVAIDEPEVRAVALTEVLTGGVWLDFCSGIGRDDWAKTLVEKIKEFAHEQGKPLKIFCRPGWARWLKKEFGFRETHRFLEEI